jgi:hypothetical protein
MDMSRVFGVFSRRAKAGSTKPAPLTAAFRTRVLMAFRDTVVPIGRAELFWFEVHGQLTYLHGKSRLSSSNAPSPMADGQGFVLECSDTDFLDFIEFGLASFQLGTDSQERLVREFNQFLLVDDLPYAVTDPVWTQRMERISEFGGSEHLVSHLTAYPQVIVRGSQVTYALAIEPALTLLKHPDFVSANAEFLDGLTDYRKRDYGDCLTKCGSAFESVLKVICTRNTWPYDQKDTADVLLKTVFSHKATLEPFLKEPLMIVATLRNRLSKSHGAGTAPKTVRPNRAEYAINATAAAILLLVNECT